MTDEAGPRATVPRGLVAGIVAIGVVALAALAIALWTLFGQAAAPAPAEGTFRDSGVVVGSPTVMTEDELNEFGREHGPIYWAGPKADMEYEVTVSEDGSYFVRYVPRGAAADDAERLTVATYPVVDGYELLQARAAEDGATALESQSGAVVVSLDDDDRRAYFAFPGSDFQVEVFAPTAGEALTLVSDGSVLPAM